MATWFISRHQGAIDWMKTQSIVVDHWEKHLDITQVSVGDVVIGTLSLVMAAQVLQKKARYISLVLPLSLTERGKEHTSQTMINHGAYLQEFFVVAVGEPLSSIRTVDIK